METVAEVLTEARRLIQRSNQYATLTDSRTSGSGRHVRRTLPEALSAVTGSKRALRALTSVQRTLGGDLGNFLRNAPHSYVMRLVDTTISRSRKEARNRRNRS